MNLNLFYEDFPTSIKVRDREYEIITDFREWIRFCDMMKSDINIELKMSFTLDMFKDDVHFSVDLTPNEVWDGFVRFLSMDLQEEDCKNGIEAGSRLSKPLFSYSFDGPYILAAFLHDYSIDLTEIDYMHWWKFRMLFDGLSEKNEIKQRIYYRSIDLGSIKDNDERKRIRRIQNSIRLPQEILSDGDIANAFV